MCSISLLLLYVVERHSFADDILGEISPGKKAKQTYPNQAVIPLIVEKLNTDHQVPSVSSMRWKRMGYPILWIPLKVSGAFCVCVLTFDLMFGTKTV